MPPNGHALLSASAADRWLHCPPSARLCELYEDKGSDYAAEGTDAHTLCEYKLRKALGMEATDPTENLTWFNQEMDECANDYVAYILELVEAAKETCVDPVVLVEQRVDFSRWVEQGFGTSDAILIADGTMHVIDYKHGLGILVSAVENPQLKCYGLGALELFDDIYDIDNVCVHVVQPRRQNISTFEISKDDLYRWADEVLKPTAELAFAGDGNFLCGEWCGFCKAKNECRARAEANLELARYDFKLPPLLTDEDIEDKLSSAVGFKGICRKVLIFLLVGIANILDVQVIGSGSVLRTAVIFFYISNEGVSLVENAAHLGLPVPDKLKDVLEQLHDRDGKEGQ